MIATTRAWKSERRRIAKVTRAILAARFPRCFMPKGEAKHPLSTGIELDLFRACPDLFKRDIRIALTDYTTGPRYLESIVEGVARVALDGSEAGVVTQMQARRAAGELAAARRRWSAEEVRRTETKPDDDISWRRPSDSEAAA